MFLVGLPIVVSVFLGMLISTLIPQVPENFALVPGMILIVVVTVFMTLGVLVAYDAPRWGWNGLKWGLVTLVLGPIGAIMYVWAKREAIASRMVIQ